MVYIKFRFKIIVLGDVGVGKTALEGHLRSLSPNFLNPINKDGALFGRSAIGASFSVINMDVKDTKIKLMFWIISDDEDNRFLLPSFIENAVAAILMYDITKVSSLNKLTEWLHLIADQYDDLPIVLAGNKLDMEENRAISREEGFSFQREHNLTSFMEISLKTGVGVDKMFVYLRDLLLQKYLLE